MELSDLRIFLAVSSEHGFTAAAKKLNCVQPNVTARIKKLEEKLGVQLFYRNKRDVILTPFGHQFHQYAIQIARLSREALQALRNDFGPLTIGVTQTVASAYLPEILQTYYTRFPRADITVRTLFGKGFVNDLLDYSVDYSLVEIPVNHPDIVKEYSWSQRLVIVTAPDYQLEGSEVTSLSFSSNCPYRQAMIEAFLRMKIVPLRNLKLLNVDTILASTMGGVGVTVLPKCLVDRDHIAPFVRIYDFPQRDGIAIVNLVHHKNNVKTPQMMAFSQVVKEIMGRFCGVDDCSRGPGAGKGAC
jgi:LysR family transcriptional regulator, cell division regulator